MASQPHICGCYYLLARKHYATKRVYLPQVSLKVHASILETTSRTRLTQTFTNPSKSNGIKESRYIFPLFDGVSVVGFTCTVGDRVIIGEVKEKEKARAIYKDAVSKGKTAGLLEELPDSSDVFTTVIGNVPPGAAVVVSITYLGELKHDAEVDGVRFTIPTTIAPRYGDYPAVLTEGYKATTTGKGFEVTVDTMLSHGSFIQQIRSPSHPIAVSLGTTSVDPEADPASNKACATLSLDIAELDKDFVIQVVSKDIGNPKAILETHPTIPGQRALMATLVPRFNLPSQHPEIVFVCDRSGSMGGSSMESLKKALKVFLKSLPVGVKFNICSFGSHFSFLWPKSQSYSQATLQEAMSHVEQFDANFGGTEMYNPLKATLDQRFTDMNLEVFLITDGEIWNHQTLFALLNKEIGENKAPIRVFSLGIGNAFSSALVEGLARAGNGFCQAVGSDKNCAAKVVRMLKGALSPHITDYSLEIKYSGTENDDFEIIEKVADSLKLNLTISGDKVPSTDEKANKPISLFDTSPNPDPDARATPEYVNDEDGQARYAHLPKIETPKMLQVPHLIPPLFSFSRTSVYLLMSPETTQSTPTSVVLRATSDFGPLELEIPIDVLNQPGETIHQLAAKRAIADLQEGHPNDSRGWLSDAKDGKGVLIKDTYPGRFSEMIEREAVRLGVQFQVGGKWCSFVAVEKSAASNDNEGEVEIDDWECLDNQELEPSVPSDLAQNYAQVDATKSSSSSSEMISSVDSARLRVRSRRVKESSAALPPPPVPQRARMRKMTLSSYIHRGGQAGGSGRIGGRGGNYTAMPAMSMSMSPFASAGSTNDIFCDEDDLDEDIGFGAFTPPRAASSDMLSAIAGVGIADSSECEYEASDDDMGFGLFDGPSPLKKTKKKNVKPTDPLHGLISLQEFEGSWTLNAQFCQVIGLNLTKVKAAVTKLNVNEKWLATALAVRYFVNKLGHEKETWELVVEKATTWLEAQGCDEKSEVWTVEKLK